MASFHPIASYRQFQQRHPEIVRGVLIGGAFAISFAAGLFYASWALVCRAGRCPAVEVLDEYTPRQTSKLYAADGRFIAEIGLERRTVVKLDQIPPDEARRPGYKEFFLRPIHALAVLTSVSNSDHGSGIRRRWE